MQILSLLAYTVEMMLKMKVISSSIVNTIQFLEQHSFQNVKKIISEAYLWRSKKKFACR